MKAASAPLISTAFSEKSMLSKHELMAWLQRIYPDASSQTLTWRISDLKHRGVLQSIGRGVYRLSTAKAFQPILGNLTKRIAKQLAKELPLVESCIWETRWISSWMNLQPAATWIMVEVEKEMLESVFYRLKEQFKNVFLDPDRKMTELYLLHLNEAIIIKPLVKEAPMRSDDGILTAMPEKILVDIVAEPDLFQAQQGELEDIFNVAFQELPINQSKMLRYAGRRRKQQAVEQLIPAAQKLIITPQDIK
jgi:hypothetical protein